ncbi:2-ketoarginine methyltransferase [Catenulispora sp. GP43]|uniref:2-ketoarginine methyltransferase n=1 Tax=Catenulispora sp. GP43 TaxID=3156263 RepID=UPI003511E979
MSEFEGGLVDALQPIRHYFLAQVLDYGLRSGLLDELAAAPGRPLPELAAACGLDRERLAGLLRYLSAEEMVTEPETAPALTARGQDVLAYRPWYELLLGGYSDTFKELPAVLADRKAYAGRDGAMVGKGSCGISRHDAIPLVRGLLAKLPTAAATLVDLGCGDGTFLLDLCESEGDGENKGRGIGVDPFGPSIEAARRQAEARGAADRVRFVASPAEEYAFDDPAMTAPCSIAAFSLQEVLEQSGHDAVVDLVRRALAPAGAHLAVVEVDHRPSDAVVRHGLGLAYYNPYYLLHQVTEQRLETAAFWRGLFAQAGAEIVAEHTVDPDVDSTGLELGFLLRPAGAAI